MNRKDIEAFVREKGKQLKTKKDISYFTQMLTKVC